MSTALVEVELRGAAAPDVSLSSERVSSVPLPSPQELMEVQVPVVGNRQCFCDYAERSISITDTMICAGLRAGGKDSCQVILKTYIYTRPAEVASCLA